MSAPFGHKLYQNEVLTSLRTYLRRCAETNDPARAFREVTEELWGQESDYRAVSNLPEGVAMPPDMPFVCLRVPTGGGKTVIGARRNPRRARRMDGPGRASRALARAE